MQIAKCNFFFFLYMHIIIGLPVGLQLDVQELVSSSRCLSASVPSLGSKRKGYLLHVLSGVQRQQSRGSATFSCSAPASIVLVCAIVSPSRFLQ
jgi:hypothetical protein